LCRRGGSDDFVKILDFGISKILHAPTMSTRTGMIFGTPNYMSPEQAEGRQSEIDRRTDIFALGTVLCDGLSGRGAFQSPTPVGTIYQVCHGVPESIRKFAPAVPVAVERTIARAMAKRREQRYPSAAAFCNDFLRACGVSRRISLAQTDSAEQSMVPGPDAPRPSERPSTLSATASELYNESRRRRNLRVPLVVGGLGLAAAGVVALALTARRPPAAP